MISSGGSHSSEKEQKAYEALEDYLSLERAVNICSEKMRNQVFSPRERRFNEALETLSSKYPSVAQVVGGADAIWHCPRPHRLSRPAVTKKVEAQLRAVEAAAADAK
jgi:uncharacterized protein YfaA (DUF2138 family)